MEADNKQSRHSLWHLFGVLILSIRFVQGWVYWGGGSRRFIFAPKKLDPDSMSFMAHKLQTAMPGALFDVDKIISSLLHHPLFLYGAVILFSFAELVCGIFLILGLFTRASGLVSALLSISLMIMFGWQGSTCMDEWTMAASNTAMGLTLALTGAYAYSFDALLARRNPHLEQKKWFRVLASGPLNEAKLKKVALFFFLFCFVFTLGTYNHYRGAILSRYHTGPVNPRTHHIALTNADYRDGNITFQAYADSGDPATPAYIMNIMLTNSKGTVIRAWQGKSLRDWPEEKIKNDYIYNKIMPGKYGLNAYVGAKAIMTIPEKIWLDPGTYKLKVDTVDGLSNEISFTVR